MIACIVCVLLAGPAWAQRARGPARPPATPTPTAPAEPTGALGTPTDDEVATAIQKGLAWLYSKQAPDGSWPSRHGRQHPGGPECLVVLAALSAGEDANRPEIRKAMEYIRRMDPQTVYARSMRAMVFARLSGEAGGKAAVAADANRRLTEDVAWLVKALDKSGGWGYGPGHPTTSQSPGWLDCSNSLMATMALDEAADAGAPVPSAAWVKIKAFWVSSQNDDGGWGYQAVRDKSLRLRGSSYGSMTAGALAAGLASMEHDLPSLDTMAGMPFAGPRSAEGADEKMADRGLAWLSANFASDHVPKWVWGGGEDWLLFYHWHLARAAGMAGLRWAGPQDWWALLAACELSLQHPDGSWSAAQDSGKDDSKDPVTRTAMAVLALSEGRRPVAIGKLALEGRWAGASRDAANVSRWLGSVTGQPLGWQGLDANVSHRTMAEAPILYFEVPAQMDFSQDQFAEMHAFLMQGGTLVVQCPPQDSNFGLQVANYLRAGLRVPRAEPLKADHPLFHARFAVPPAQGFTLADDLRTRAFIFVTDISGPAHRGTGKEALAAFGMWANLLEYATDGQPLPGKLSFRHAAAAPAETARSAAVGRLKHKGDWDICPRAIDRLSEVLTAAVSAGAQEQPVEAAQAASCKAPLLWVAGTQPLEFSQQEIAQIKKYVEGGGTLFIDSTASGDAFLQSAVKLAKDLSGQDAKELPADHPLLTGKFAGGAGSDVSTVAWSRAAAKKLGAPQGKGGLLGVAIGGRAAIVISPYSVTAPLEGAPTFGLVGLSVPDARRLAANLVLYTSFKTE